MFQEVLTEPLHSTGDMYHNEEKLFSALGPLLLLEKISFPRRTDFHSDKTSTEIIQPSHNKDNHIITCQDLQSTYYRIIYINTEQ